MTRLARALVVVAIALSPARAEPLPVVKGEAVVGSGKSSSLAALLTTEEEMPARAIRLAEPSEQEWRALEASPSAAKRATVGFGRDIAKRLEEGAASAIAWSRVGEWRIAKLRVRSPGAKAIRVGLRVGSTRQPWSLRVAGSDDESKALGPARHGGPLGKADLTWTPVTEGDAQVIEIASPVDEPEPAVEVASLSHLVTGPSSRFRKTVAHIGISGLCQFDLACVPDPSQALLDAGKAVVHMVFTARSGISYMCTGTMLNDTHAGTQVPYLFSSNHCFEAASPPYNDAAQMQLVANTLNTYFFFDATACRSLAVPPFVQRFGGATFLYNHQAQDILLVRLNDWAPAGTYLSGWDPNPLAGDVPVTMIHHPWGDLKMYATGSTGALATLPSPLNAPTGFRQVFYDQGSAEPGSSGAAILTLAGGEYLVRGALWGGASSCTARSYPDYFSRFDVAYPNLRPWLEATSLPDFDVTDLWWNAQESGWGMSLTQRPNGQVFAVWFTHAADSRPLWLAMSGGRWTTGRTFTGTLYRASGPGYAQQPFDPGEVTLKEAGSLTLDFADANHGTVTWVVDGVQGTKAITRLPF